MSQNLRDALQAFAHTLSEEDNAAHDLWSWLPSKHVASQVHSDSEVANMTPSIEDTLKEASTTLALLAGHSFKERELRRELLICDCDLCRMVFSEQLVEFFKEKFNFTLEVQELLG